MFSQAKTSWVAFKRCFHNMFVAQEAFRARDKSQKRELSGLDVRHRAEILGLNL
jgi:hypothetical protein